MSDADEMVLGPIGPPGYDPLWDDLEPYRHYDRSGNVISFRDWARLREFAGLDYSIVKQEYIGDYFLSTVWIGIDTGFRSLGGEALIFETMVFSQKEDEEDDFSGVDQWRYPSEEEALAGHERVAEQLRVFKEVE